MKETKFIGRSCCAETIQQLSYGKRFWVKFRKKNGEVRELDGEIRPPKKSDHLPPSAYNPDLIVVGDRHIYHENLESGMPEEKAKDKSYRCVSISQLMEFQIDQQLYIVEDDNA